jgi:hypothetical protein
LNQGMSGFKCQENYKHGSFLENSTEAVQLMQRRD